MKISYLCLMSAILLFHHAGFAAEDKTRSDETAIGVVLAYLGDVTALSPEEEERTLDYGSGIWTNDIIGVGDGGKLQLLLTDGTLLSVAAGSIFRITDYVYESSTRDTLKVEIIEGTIRMLSGEIDKKENPGIQVLTPEGNVYVEGTLFTTNASKDGTAVGFFRGWGNLNTKTGVVSLGKGKDFDFGFVPAGEGNPPLGQLAEPRTLASIENAGVTVTTPTAVTPVLQSKFKIRPVTTSTLADIKNRIRLGGRFAERARIQLRDRQVNLHADGIDCKCTKRK